MNTPEQSYQAAHEVGKVYDAILDRKVLIDFFLTTVFQFIPAQKGCLFLATQNRTLLLEATSPVSDEGASQELTEAARKVFESGKPSVSGQRLFLPLIVRNNSLGVACFERSPGSSGFTSKEMEIGFDLASQFSGALKNNLLFEENIKMERLAAVGQAMGMVIHEIRNIMQLARFSDEMTRMGIAEKNEKFLEQGLSKMKKTMKEMDGFIWEMLSLTKDYQLEPEKTDIPAILQELQSDLAERAEGYKIQLDFKADPGFPAVEGDGRSLYRALLNLVKNAFEAFADTKDACVRIRARVKDEDCYELIVEDNASGMSEEVKAKLFEAFFSTKGKRGTGLGLMVVARTAKMHQGAVAVKSQPGVGTKFILTLRRSFSKNL
jgi:signal transduction histidine kinase